MKKIWMVLHGQSVQMISTIGRWTTFSAVAILLGACVTINIYFPAAAVEKAADKIIDEVWQLQRKNNDSSNKPAAAEAGGNAPTGKETK